MIRPLGRDFFIDPKSAIDPAELATRLNPPGTQHDFIGVLADGKFHFRFFSTTHSVGFEDELQSEHGR